MSAGKPAVSVPNGAVAVPVSVGTGATLPLPPRPPALGRRVSLVALMSAGAPTPVPGPAPAGDSAAAAHPESATSSAEKYHRLVIVPAPHSRYSDEEMATCQGLRTMLGLRAHYVYRPKPHGWKPSAEEAKRWAQVTWKAVDGVYQVFPAAAAPAAAADAKTGTAAAAGKPAAGAGSGGAALTSVISYAKFASDLQALWSFVKSGPVRTVCFRRLQLLEKKYGMYVLLNGDLEVDSSKDDPRDFYNTVKVDNHIHIAAAMTSKHLLSFIKTKVKTAPTDVVLMDHQTKQPVTLQQLFQRLDLTPDGLSLDQMAVSGGGHMFHRFDHFNNSYSPFGYNDLRTVFSKIQNVQNGRYFAEIVGEVFALLQTQDNGCYMEPRVSVYASGRTDWQVVADWICRFNLFSDRIVWMVQLPRLYELYHRNKLVTSFQQLLDNFFAPLFEVTDNPASNPTLHRFLQHVVGFDSVDDEGHYDDLVVHQYRTPADWTDDTKPPYSYMAYYMYANLMTLNRFREVRGLNTFAFRPHTGEAGQPHHLATSFMLAESIAHGINLDRSPPLQYLYYLARVGLSVSPLSNNTLYRALKDNPFHALFQRGLNVTLSTDDPLQFHTTAEPLIEEYTIAKQFWQLNSAELSELANASVRQSGFPHAWKQAALGDRYHLANTGATGAMANDINKTNVPDCRVAYRTETLHAEYQFVWRASHQLPPAGAIATAADAKKAPASAAAGAGAGAKQAVGADPVTWEALAFVPPAAAAAITTTTAATAKPPLPPSKSVAAVAAAK